MKNKHNFKTNSFRRNRISRVFGFSSFLFILLFTFKPTSEKHKWCYAEIIVPAEYKTVEKREITNPDKIVPEQILTKRESTKFIPILCEKDLTKNRLKSIRKALQKRNYDTNNLKPYSSIELLPVLKLFQKENNLAIGFYSLETLDKLGLNFWWLSIKNGNLRCYEKNLITDKYKTVTDTIRPYDVEHIITKRVLIEKGGFTRYVPCLCEKDLTKNKIKKIKKRLLEKGYPIDKVSA